jgi:hypothetical protein
MELLADRDHEEARRLLYPVLERMMEAVHRHEGTVNQVMVTASWRSLAPTPFAHHFGENVIRKPGRRKHYACH